MVFVIAFYLHLVLLSDGVRGAIVEDKRPASPKLFRQFALDANVRKLIGALYRDHTLESGPIAFALFPSRNRRAREPWREHETSHSILPPLFFAYFFLFFLLVIYFCHDLLPHRIIVPTRRSGTRHASCLFGEAGVQAVPSSAAQTRRRFLVSMFPFFSPIP